ncbi:Pmr5/Cas1p GDSL/SGNH-like acyl-esterase family protein [Rhynchospora pubera]|uniref:Pmr5/Cas1p GDSL/SGNH-like acyl-esterase family protein n=1 Tax=Rhynchospora pubera TaxID=906938 RepID=A0AAV8GF92_9POAL|nr:Pmr5/Cas1p GDSL/SGNH-like acyl-esterase family protein [Rhynchospora pubera]
MGRWRLSRRKLLFLCVLCTSLLLFLHLPTSPHHFSLSQSSTLCLSRLHRISWTHSPSPAWSWAKSENCYFRRFSRKHASELLRGAWILAAGDSQARLVVLALLRLLLDPTEVSTVEPDLFRRHSDYHITLPDRGIRVDFIWAPYESNITWLLRDIRHTRHYPDLLILGSGLWHMLHITNPSLYGTALTEIKQEAVSLLEPSGSLHPHMFWLGLPKLVNSKLNTEEKKEKMTGNMLEAYNWEVKWRGMPKGSSGPFMLLDIGLLTRGCGPLCTLDGMHYDGAVYDAAVNIMLNSMLIESQ